MAQTQMLREAVLSIHNDNYDLAVQQLTDLIYQNPENAQALMHRATAYALAQKQEQSEKDLEAFFKHQPNWVKEGALLSGWLKKYPEVGQAKTRYFYLKKRLLAYYKEPQSPDPIQSLILHHAQVSMSGKTSLKFQVVLPHHKYILEAESEADKDNWGKALENALADEKTIHLVVPRLGGTSSSANPANTPAPTTPRGTTAEDGDYLYKRGGKNPAWKQRWCVIRGTLLYYYESPEDKEPKGTMELRNCKVMLVADEAESGKLPKFKFVVQPPDRRTLFMYADQDEVRKKWIKKLQAAANKAVAVPATRPDNRQSQDLPSDSSNPEATSFMRNAQNQNDGGAESGDEGIAETRSLRRSGGASSLPKKAPKSDGGKSNTMSITEENVTMQRRKFGGMVNDEDEDLHAIDSFATPPTPSSYTANRASFENEETKRNIEAAQRGKQSALGYGSSYAGGGDDEFDEEGDDFVPGLGGDPKGGSSAATQQDSSCSMQ